MDLVKLSIGASAGLVGALMLLPLTRHGQAEPLQRPGIAEAQPPRATELARAPVLVAPSATKPLARSASDLAYGSLFPFPVAPTSTPPPTFDQRWRGQPNDWNLYIDEASRRFGVPPSWIRSVMRAESNGLQFFDGRPITSSKGAMGLMQLMPETYAELRARYGFGPDPYDPHDNIIAGAAYIRLMALQFGAPGFAAAYNAGPGRYADFLAHGRPLPGETRNYLATVGAALGGVDARTISAPARDAAGVRDLTTAELALARPEKPLSAPRSPAGSSLFVQAMRTASTPESQPVGAPSDGLFVVLSTADRRRAEVPADRTEN